MSKIFKWLGLVVLAGAFWASPFVFAHGQETNQAGSASKKVNAMHSQELKSQRRRLKESGKSVRAEALQSGHHSTPPKTRHHQMRKVQRNAGLQSPNLRGARKHNRSRSKVHHQAPRN